MNKGVKRHKVPELVSTYAIWLKLDKVRVYIVVYFFKKGFKVCSIELIVILFKTINLRVRPMKLVISCDISTMSLCSFILAFMWKLLGLWRLR